MTCELPDGTPSRATVHGGGWSLYHAHKTVTRLLAEQRLAEAEREVRHVARHGQRQREKQDKRSSHGHRNRDKAGVSKMQIDMWKDRADHTHARHSHHSARKTMAAQSRLSMALDDVDILEKPRFAIASTGLLPRQPLLALHDVAVGPDAEHPIIRHLDLIITGSRRVAIRGPNGSGKTTLLRLITGALPASSGSVQRPDAIAVLDQHLSLLNEMDTALGNVRHHNPGMTQNEGHAALARFLFRANEAHHLVHSMSGGEKMRLALCCILGTKRPPPLLLLDEPTNHLDMTAIAALEAALSAYDGAILVVSHDQTFLDNLGITHTITMPVNPF